jgi:hypothetical protein
LPICCKSFGIDCGAEFASIRRAIGEAVVFREDEIECTPHSRGVIA